MRRSSLIMLVAAIVLGLVAVFVARTLLPGSRGTVTNAVVTVPAVVAVQTFAFGEKIVAEKLKVIQWPATSVPAGTFQRVADAVQAGDHVALRAIDANELVTAKAISGKDGRLSASTLLGPTMRAVSVPVGEASAAAGFVIPGDRVDVYLVRSPDGEELPYADQLAQNIRVLAVGQDSNVGKDKPEVTKTVTLEMTPLQAQRVSLAQTVGQLSLSLRNIKDESRTPLQTAQLLDLNDGTVTRILRKPAKVAEDDQSRTARALGSALGTALRQPGSGPPPGAPRTSSGPTIEVFRGTTATPYSVPAGS